MNPNHENLINSLVNGGYLKTPLLVDAFKKIDRVGFVPDEYKNNSYENVPLPIGYGQTISQPLTVAFIFELLDPKPGEKILDIGAGSGWTTAILAYIVSQNGNSNSQLSISKVIGVERIQELAEFAGKNLEKYGFIQNGTVKIFVTDGSKGYKKEAPFDKIIAGASAEGDVPEEWKKQLKIGGRMVAPVGNSVVVIDKTGKAKYSKKTYFGFSFVPLVSDK